LVTSRWNFRNTKPQVESAEIVSAAVAADGCRPVNWRHRPLTVSRGVTEALTAPKVGLRGTADFHVRGVTGPIDDLSNVCCSGKRKYAIDPLLNFAAPTAVSALQRLLPVATRL